MTDNHINPKATPKEINQNAKVQKISAVMKKKDQAWSCSSTQQHGNYIHAKFEAFFIILFACELHKINAQILRKNLSDTDEEEIEKKLMFIIQACNEIRDLADFTGKKSKIAKYN